MDLTGIEDRLQGVKLRTRFAPTPSGFLHLGHIAHCIYVWGIARSLNGQVLLRIEDHDRQRSKHCYTESILQDLDWLGFEANEGYRSEVDGESFVQSANSKLYEDALSLLKEKGVTYFCTCSRKLIKERMKSEASGRGYDGHCRQLKHPLKGDASIRLEVNSKMLSFWDATLGDSFQNPGLEFGDLMLKDRRLNFSYHLSVVVDDLRHKVNVLIRGLDLLPATGVQLYLRNLLEQKPTKPIFVHHPLLYQKDKPSIKLSKRNWDASIASFRKSGFSADQLIGQVAFELGLTKSEGKLKVRDLKSLWA